MTENNESNGPSSAPVPAYEANFGWIIGKRKFASAEDLAKWANRNKEAFAWLATVGGTDQRTSSARDTQWNAVDRLAKAAEALRNASDDTTRTQAVALLNTNVERFFKKKHILSAEDPRATFLSDLAKTDVSIAAMVLGLYNKTANAPSDLQQFDAYFRAMFFELGLRDTAEPERKRLAELHAEWIKTTEKFSTLVAENEVQLAEWRTARGADSTRQSEIFQQAQETRDQGFSKLLTEHREQLEGFKKAYNEELATRSAVSYWGNKAHMHRLLGGLSAIVTVVGGVGYFGLVLPKAFSNLVDQFGVNENQPEWRAGIAVALVLLGIWLGRIAVRLFFSQLHLATDASHRRVALLSYIALLQEPNAVTKEDRSLVLGTVFRPISDGMIRDDAMPPSPWELLTRPPKSQ